MVGRKRGMSHGQLRGAVKVWMAGVSAALAIAVLAPSCSEAKGGGDGSNNPAGPPILIGASVGLTGDLSGNRRALTGAVAVAQQQINAAGGILGRQVVFKIEDDASDKTVAPKTINDLILAGVNGVIGPGASSEVLAVEPLLAQARIVELSATATSPALTASQTNKQGYFFRTVPPDQLQGKAVVQFALRGPAGGVSCKKMAIVHNDDSYGNSMDAVIEPYFTGKGGTVVPAAIKIPADVQPSYKTEAAQIIAARPECVAMIVFAPAGAQFVRDMKAAIASDTTFDWSKFFFIGTDGCFDPLFISDGRANPSDPASPTIVDGVYGTNADTNPPGRPEYNELKTLYISQLGLAPDQNGDLDPYTANEYDAAILIALAIQTAGGVDDGSKIRDAMFGVSRGPGKTFGPLELADAIDVIKRGQGVNYNGASGDVDFDDSGDVVSDYIIWRVQSTPAQQFITADRVKASDLQ